MVFLSTWDGSYIQGKRVSMIVEDTSGKIISSGGMRMPIDQRYNGEIAFYAATGKIIRPELEGVNKFFAKWFVDGSLIPNSVREFYIDFGEKGD
jgi:hypothetical protein